MKTLNKIISFSLWGSYEDYCQGAIRNVELAKEVYDGWQTRFYCREDVPSETISQLCDGGAEVIVKKQTKGDWEGLFWRFLPMDDEDVDIFIVRDTDSRLDYREKACVDEWLNTYRAVHIIRDYPEHGIEILGGTWGCQDKICNMQQMIDGWNEFNKKGCDQRFLKQKLWPIVESNHLAHDEIFNISYSLNFPKHRPTKLSEFVGQQFNKDDERVFY